MMNTVRLLGLELDAPVSELGKRQIIDMKMILDDANFWATHNPDLLMHSPMIRAVATCDGLFPTINENKVEVACLREASPTEHVFHGTWDTRIQEFYVFLANQTAKTIVIVGHSQYFRRMLGVPSLLKNCDVWSTKALIRTDADSGRVNIQWNDINLLHRTVLSEDDPHGDEDGDAPQPQQVRANTNRISSRANRWAVSNEDDDADDIVNDLDPNEPVCRICHVTRSECPGMRFIKPCLCSGSLAYVHLECLNRWRATETSRQYSCSVCKYKYRTRRKPIADILMSEQGAMYVTIIIIVTLVAGTGMLIQVGSYYAQYDAMNKIYEMLHWQPWWRHCDRMRYRRYDSYPNSFEGWRQMFKRWFVLLDSAEYRKMLLCTTATAVLVDTTMLGCIVIGSLGTAAHMHELFKDATVGMAAAGFTAERLVQRLMRRDILMLVLSFANMFNAGPGAANLSIALGCIVSFMKVYALVSGTGRRLAQTLGEQILEVD
jgi:phosphohistidine phosphatase SixA